MTRDYRSEAETHFLEGKVAADAGQGEEICPYRSATDGADQEELIARINWRDGFALATFARLLQARQTKRREIVAALSRLLFIEHRYGLHLATVKRGWWPNPIRYWQTKRALAALRQEMHDSKDYRFLDGLRIQVYAPLPGDGYSDLAVHDRLLDVFSKKGSEETIRTLVERYGDAHGVRATWHAYVSAEPIRALVAEAGATEAVQVH